MKAVEVEQTDLGYGHVFAIVPNAVSAENISITWNKTSDYTYPILTNSLTGKSYEYEWFNDYDLESFVSDMNEHPCSEFKFTDEFAEKYFNGDLDDEAYEKVAKDYALYRWKGRDE